MKLEKRKSGGAYAAGAQKARNLNAADYIRCGRTE
jgi:hypothetical protein